MDLPNLVSGILPAQACSTETSKPSGDAIVDLRLREFSLDCLLRLAVKPTLESKGTLHVLGGCDAGNVHALERALSLVIERCMSG